jgi:hypothetical protein
MPRTGQAKDSEEDYASFAWLLIGTFRTAAGWLDLTAGRLRFSTPDEVVFDIAVEHVADVDWPWYYFGGGVKLTAAGVRYRLSFVLPNGGEYPAAGAATAAGDPAALALVRRRASDVGAGHKVGKEWQRRLAAAVSLPSAGSP